MTKNQIKKFSKTELDSYANLKDITIIPVSNILDIFEVLDWCFK